MIGNITKIGWNGRSSVIVEEGEKQNVFEFSTREDFDKARDLAELIIRNYQGKAA